MEQGPYKRSLEHMGGTLQGGQGRCKRLASGTVGSIPTSLTNAALTQSVEGRPFKSVVASSTLAGSTIGSQVF